MKLTVLFSCGAAAVTWSQPSLAMPSFLPESQASVHRVRMVCDEWGRCWDQPTYRTQRPYGYGDPYVRGEDRRPPSKWERKGFCPPGQAKKGNC
ncbi:hypothetical protein GCM10007036_43400 [Alsobacter metallidurans]|uniref:Secreted protein n=1 Tax=Alsobacter metallidurans TaxID=340221 RepID=A0A917MJL1_9HYPH|nr:hypothetical protein GCM10007036_43400 [Alsobacter metallidurans]